MSGWIDPLIFEYPFDWEGKTCARTFASCTYACCASLQAAHPDAMKSIPRCALVASTCFNQNRKLPGAHIFEKPLPIFTLEKLPSCVLYRGGGAKLSLGEISQLQNTPSKKKLRLIPASPAHGWFWLRFLPVTQKKAVGRPSIMARWLFAPSFQRQHTSDPRISILLQNVTPQWWCVFVPNMLRDTFCCIEKSRQAHVHIFTGHLSVHENEVGDDERSPNSFGNDQRIHHCHQMVVVLPITWKER